MNKKPGVSYTDVFLMLITGIGVGWLIGLSVSSVLHIIVGSTIALVAGTVGALVGLTQGAGNKAESVPESVADDKPKFLPSRKSVILINPLPLTMLVIGLGVGSALGIYARTNDLFGPEPQKFARKWAGTGLDEKKIQRRLFDQLYPPKEVTEASENGGATPSESEASSGTDKQNSNTGNQDVSRSTHTAASVENKPAAAKADKAPDSRQKGEESPRTRQLSAGLYAVTAEDCQMLRLKHGEELRTRLKALGDKRIIDLADECKNDNCLEALKESICQNTQ